MLGKIKGFSSELALCIRWPKYSSYSICPSSLYSRLISFRVDWFDLFEVHRTQESSQVPQFESISSLAFSGSACFIVQLSHSYITTGKTIALTIRTFVGKVMSLHLNTLLRFVTDSFPRSKHLLISWLQSPSAVIFGAQEKKICHCFYFLPFYLS